MNVTYSYVTYSFALGEMGISEGLNRTFALIENISSTIIKLQFKMQNIDLVQSSVC